MVGHAGTGSRIQTRRIGGAARYDSELEGGMKYEPIFFFEDLLADNRSLLNLIDSDFTYVNRSAGQTLSDRAASFANNPRESTCPRTVDRGGLLGMSAVLAVSSFPHEPAPCCVANGFWKHCWAHRLLRRHPTLPSLMKPPVPTEPAVIARAFGTASRRCSVCVLSCHDGSTRFWIREL